MVEASLAQVERTNTRAERGRRLFEEHVDSIWFSAHDRAWIVPSEHDGTSVYLVRLSRRESCECLDHEFHPEESCKHIVAAVIARSKTAVCDGCGQRRRRRDLVEVEEDHESLTFYPGDRVCELCAGAHGVL